MKVGKKGTGQDHIGKTCVARHNHRMTRRAAAALEKALETKVRQAARKEIEDRRGD